MVSRKSLEKIHDSINYYPHQIVGIRELAKRNSFILADEMGLGKSLQALTVAAIDYERGRARRVLVVAPASLKGNWADEITTFTSFSHVVVDGTPNVRKLQLKEYEDSGAEFLIVNYEQVKAHLDLLNKFKFDIVIFDEAHYLKSHKTQRTVACHKLKARRKFLLTGSPILNQVNELWSLLHIVSPIEYPKYWQFVNRYAVWGGYKDKQIVGVKNEKELIDKIDIVMLRRLKRDVLDLPEKQYITVRVDLSEKQRALYRQASEDMKIDSPGSASPMEIQNALTKFLRLKQICGTTATIPGYDDDSIKLDVAVDKIQEVLAGGRPTVVFTQFREVQQCLMNRLAEKNLATYQLNGDTPTSERVPIVKAWAAHGEPVPGQKHKNPRACMVAMLQVAGVGLNMTAANTAIFVDKLFVPKLNEQAEDRIHRIGADKSQPIQIIELIARNTIESRIEVILKRKRKLFDTLVDNDTAWKKALIEAMQEDE